MSMRQSDWDGEVEAAADWWTDRLSEAVARHFPPTSLFGEFGRQVATPESLAAFRSRLVEEMNTHLHYNERTGKPWDRSVPLANATYRKFGKEGGYVATPIQYAAQATGFEEVLPSIPEGCMAVVNPGKVFAAESRKHKDVVLTVAYRPPVHVMESTGDGI